MTPTELRELLAEEYLCLRCDGEGKCSGCDGSGKREFLGPQIDPLLPKLLDLWEAAQALEATRDSDGWDDLADALSALGASA